VDLSVSSVSDTSISANVSVHSDAPNTTCEVSVTSQGWNGMGFSLRPVGGGSGQQATGRTSAALHVVSSCGDERDTIIQEYATYCVSLTPSCSDFNTSASSEYFQHSELVVNEPYSWSLIRQPLTINKSVGYGLDRWRELSGGTHTVTSGYRGPAHNQAKGGAPNSRHQYGDAVDLRNVTHSQQEYIDLRNAAKDGNPNAGASWVEDTTGPCALNCVHADWRNRATVYAH
jgi:hypothetical protein